MTVRIEHTRVQANGITFHAASGPRGAPAALCVHGFPEGWMSWRPVMERLPDVRLYAPNLRGYPGTERSRDGYDVFTLTDNVNALGIDQPVLVGHHWGTSWAGSSRTPTRTSSTGWWPSTARIRGRCCARCCAWTTFRG